MSITLSSSNCRYSYGFPYITKSFCVEDFLNYDFEQHNVIYVLESQKLLLSFYFPSPNICEELPLDDHSRDKSDKLRTVFKALATAKKWIMTKQAIKE